MPTLKLYFATNRNHLINPDNETGTRFRPDGYGGSFSTQGHENLRFGKLSLKADASEIKKYLEQKIKSTGTGNGEGLSSYLAKCAASAQRSGEAGIRAYRENTPGTVLGSEAMFSELKKDMENASDLLVYIHGFNVSWHDAVGSALSLQTILNHKAKSANTKNLIVVLFTWPSDGKMIPFASYRSDKADAAASAKPVARALLKTRDFLIKLGKKNLCQQNIHLLCHSMGNYVLQNALHCMQEFNSGTLPRIFEHVFLCSADVDDAALEPGAPLEPVHQISRQVTVYHNREDKALVVSDYTKGQPERLGGAGAARPNQLHNKVHQVDCTPTVQGTIEHSYYLCGNIAGDIRASIDGLAQGSPDRARVATGSTANVWSMT